SDLGFDSSFGIRHSSFMQARNRGGFPRLQEQFTRWLRPAHVIESKLLCIARARGQNPRNKVYNKRRMKGLVASAPPKRLASMFARGIWPSHGWDEIGCCGSEVFRKLKNPYSIGDEPRLTRT